MHKGTPLAHQRPRFPKTTALCAHGVDGLDFVHQGKALAVGAVLLDLFGGMSGIEPDEISTTFRQEFHVILAGG